LVKHSVTVVLTVNNHWTRSFMLDRRLTPFGFSWTKKWFRLVWTYDSM